MNVGLWRVTGRWWGTSLLRLGSGVRDFHQIKCDLPSNSLEAASSDELHRNLHKHSRDADSRAVGKGKRSRRVKLFMFGVLQVAPLVVGIGWLISKSRRLENDELNYQLILKLSEAAALSLGPELRSPPTPGVPSHPSTRPVQTTVRQSPQMTKSGFDEHANVHNGCVLLGKSEPLESLIRSQIDPMLTNSKSRMILIMGTEARQGHSVEVSLTTPRVASDGVGFLSKLRADIDTVLQRVIHRPSIAKVFSHMQLKLHCPVRGGNEPTAAHLLVVTPNRRAFVQLDGMVTLDGVPSGCCTTGRFSTETLSFCVPGSRGGTARIAWPNQDKENRE